MNEKVLFVVSLGTFIAVIGGVVMALASAPWWSYLVGLGAALSGAWAGVELSDWWSRRKQGDS